MIRKSVGPHGNPFKSGKRQSWMQRLNRLTWVIFAGVVVIGCMDVQTVFATQTPPQDELSRLDDEGRLTVRALMGWGALPDRFKPLIFEMRRQGHDLLGADAATILSWLRQDGSEQTFTPEQRTALRELAIFMLEGNYFEQSSSEETKQISPDDDHQLQDTLPAPFELASAHFESGLRAYKRADYETALREFSFAADQGHVGAQNEIGFMYAYGRGVAENQAEAVRWYQMAADQGHADAQSALEKIIENQRSKYITLNIDDLKLDIERMNQNMIEVYVKLYYMMDTVTLSNPSLDYDMNPVYADISNLSRDGKAFLLKNCSDFYGCNVSVRGHVGKIMFMGNGIIIHEILN
ncbi:tetratricopeptide repeat protein [Desulfonatronum sp. SC1]|uniref:tetratricopeptide repeat protein n=1 Tax=Desulfonatronum sp. SC1 TaxID=2109626 RepID=UPI000D3235D8|nr:tetratricopeptide repeat protein [Desulfonatronum sp. SC1]PTN32751.1 hypothetical protein C6366_16005 [Desulfonatronum sp. SC1]